MNIPNTSQCPSSDTQIDWEKRERNERYHRLLASSELPIRHVGMIKGVEKTNGWGKALKDIKALIGKGTIVGLVGSRGTGKTQLCAVACAYSAWNGRGARYITVMDLLSEIKETYTDGGKERVVLSKYKNVPLLVLDEWQERSDTSWEASKLTNLIDYRYGALLDTIIVANQTPKEFMASIGESIFSRMQETGLLVECTWKSFREKR